MRYYRKKENQYIFIFSIILKLKNLNFHTTVYHMFICLKQPKTLDYITPRKQWPRPLQDNKNMGI